MSKSVRLIIEDGDLACWRPINNTFVQDPKGWSPTKNHWNGLLIELGDYKEFKTRKERSVFASVQFKDAAGKEQTFLRHFSWIDIVAERNKALRPIPVKHNSKNFKNWKVRTKADPFFKRFARITYWHDWDGYDIEVREHYIGGRLSLRYVFTLHEVGELYVIPKKGSGGKRALIPLENVSEIVVNGIRLGRGPGGGTTDPPPKEP